MRPVSAGCGAGCRRSRGLRGRSRHRSDRLGNGCRGRSRGTRGGRSARNGHRSGDAGRLLAGHGVGGKHGARFLQFGRTLGRGRNRSLDHARRRRRGKRRARTGRRRGRRGTRGRGRNRGLAAREGNRRRLRARRGNRNHRLRSAEIRTRRKADAHRFLLGSVRVRRSGLDGTWRRRRSTRAGLGDGTGRRIGIGHSSEEIGSRPAERQRISGAGRRDRD